MNHCKLCKTPTKNRVFCSARCNGLWVTTTPEGRARFYTAERGIKIAAGRKETFRKDPERYAVMRRAQSEAMDRYMNSLTPAQKEQRRANMSRILKEIGHKPSIRGGNGTGPTAAEQLLLNAFPKAKNNYPIRTGMKAGSGYPTCYKVDLGFPGIRLAIEADGNSHKLMERREQDVKKTEFLTRIGWIVMRFTNKRIMEDTERVTEELRSVMLRLNGC